MLCFSFRPFGLVGIYFCNACGQLLESVNIEKHFPFLADVVFRARCFAYVSAVKIEPIFGSDADSVVADVPFPFRFCILCNSRNVSKLVKQLNDVAFFWLTLIEMFIEFILNYLFR